MSYKRRSIELLNKAVSDELSAVHQYMYFHFRLEDAGYEPMSKLFHRIAIVEMMHVETLAERILFLKGEVNMSVSQKVQHIHQPKEMLMHAIKMETDSVSDYNAWAQECAANGDAATKKVFENLVVVEEEHQDMFDTEHENILKFGDNFLILQSIEHSKKIAGPGTGE